MEPFVLDEIEPTRLIVPLLGALKIPRLLGDITAQPTSVAANNSTREIAPQFFNVNTSPYSRGRRYLDRLAHGSHVMGDNHHAPAWPQPMARHRASRAPPQTSGMARRHAPSPVPLHKAPHHRTWRDDVGGPDEFSALEHAMKELQNVLRPAAIKSLQLALPSGYPYTPEIASVLLHMPSSSIPSDCGSKGTEQQCHLVHGATSSAEALVPISTSQTPWAIMRNARLDRGLIDDIDGPSGLHVEREVGKHTNFPGTRTSSTQHKQA